MSRKDDIDAVTRAWLKERAPRHQRTALVADGYIPGMAATVLRHELLRFCGKGPIYTAKQDAKAYALAQASLARVRKVTA